MRSTSKNVETQNDDPLHSIESSAKYLGGISEWTVRAYLTKKLLPRTKIGGRTMIRESALNRFIVAGEK